MQSLEYKRRLKRNTESSYFIPSAFAAITIQHKGGGLKITKQAQ
jgi:hypothetical protein